MFVCVPAELIGHTKLATEGELVIAIISRYKYKRNEPLEPFKYKLYLVLQKKVYGDNILKISIMKINPIKMKILFIFMIEISKI